MQNRVIAIGGLESAYMRKLALYLSKRLDGYGQVAIVGDPKSENVTDRDTVWVGSKAFIEQIQAQAVDSRCIILAEEDDEDEAVICRYQPSEKIYQKIMYLCQRIHHTPAAGFRGSHQKWILLTTDSSVSQLLAFSFTAAFLLREKGNVLYLNLSECSGMKELFQMDAGTDLSDLILAVRREQDICLSAFVRKVENIDCVFSPDNPSVLYELREEDISGLIRAVEREQKYGYVLVALGNAFCNCEFLFRRAALILHLTREGEAFGGCTREWLHFIRLCTESQGVMIENLSIPPCRTEENGVHLLYEWKEGLLGQLAAKYMDQV